MHLGRTADNVASGARIQKQLGSEQQLAEVRAGGVGDPIAGAGGRASASASRFAAPRS
jgi:hypothetical protein